MVKRGWEEGGGFAARERASIPLEGVDGGAKSETSLVAFADRSVRDGTLTSHNDLVYITSQWSEN